MAFVPIRPKFQIEVSQEVQRKIDQSYAETLNMTFRAVRCPYCKTHIVDVFEDVIGHFAAKCPKCKSLVPINAAYFKRSAYAARMKRTKQPGR